MVKEANILVGITGSISILNLPSCLGLLKYNFSNVKVIMTESAEELIPASTISIFCDEVYVSKMKPSNERMGHVELAKWADVFIIAPATANKLAESAYGFAGDFLSATILAHPNPILYFPNMNQLMWNKPQVQRNVALLLSDGNTVVPPVKREAFEVASGTIKTNYVMPDIQVIVQSVMNEFKSRQKDLNCKSLINS